MPKRCTNLRLEEATWESVADLALKTATPFQQVVRIAVQFGLPKAAIALRAIHRTRVNQLNHKKP